MKLRIGTIAALAAGLTLAASGSAFAQGKGHGHDKDKDHDRGDEHRQEQVVQTREQRQAYEQQRQQIAYQQQQQRRDYEVQQRQLRAQERERVAQQRRDRYEYESRGNVGRNVPPGLARKPGGMPPGQYKKMYRTSDGAGVLRDVFIQRGYTVVRTQPYGASQYVYYRAPNGTLQRAIVSPGTNNQLGFSNVPADLLQLVLSRLY